ncbi:MULTISPECIES: DUF6671 family protein [unclassified Paludibacterium]|uniref:DUF6671 family protein n=1 Tax=unclassified Paludibacterium TaxID=2618429 RepID=UPI001C0559F4|nr:DUF6671 family protein [Paludibacterium sp. B53371]BEV73425.1 hypothetical protein THUN1379_29070 [Paludibacterium sp. THUN1379]
MAPDPLYAGQTVALLSLHDKARLLAPLLSQAGLAVQPETGFDTDQLGSFTREHARAGSQLQAARTKARLGMSLTGLPLGLGSEGSFGPDPFGMGLPWNVEVLVMLDDRLGLELVAWAQGPARHHHVRVPDWPALLAAARAAGFPAHRLVLRPEGPDHPLLYKGLADEGALRQAFERLQQASANGQVFMESDLRAHCNPTRQGVIVEAGQALLARLRAHCPACYAPGWNRVDTVPGLPCEACGCPTRQPLACRWVCLRCRHEQLEPAASGAADPATCDFCNP